MKDKSIVRTSLHASLVFSATLASAFGGTTAPAIMETPAASSAWEFRVEAYGWLTGLNGDIEIANIPVAVDESFSDLLDYLDVAAALQFEARNGRWGIVADGFYVELSNSGDLGDVRYSSAEFKSQQFLGELYGTFRIAEGASGFCDVYAGLRYNYFSADLSANGVSPTPDFDVSKSRNWTDPLIGLRGQWNITEKFFFAAKGDVGGFGVSSDLAWTLQGTFGYQFTPNVSSEIGYRYLHTDYTDGGFKYDVAQAGLITGLTIKF